MDDNLDAIVEMVKKARDDKRPTMKMVVDVMNNVFSKFGDALYQRHDTGPVTWSWVDRTNTNLGYEKWFVVSGSTMGDAFGYPMLTIRQAIAPRLDAWVSVSQLIVGDDVAAIESSFALAIMNHSSAFDGMRNSVTDLINNLDKTQLVDVASGHPISSSKKESN